MKKGSLVINKETILNMTVLFFAFFPIIPNFMKGLPIIFLILAAIFSYKKEKIHWFGFLINASLYITFIASLLYTSNFDYAFKKLETMLSIVILPIVFFVLLPKFKVAEELKRNFFKFFIITTTIFSAAVIYTILLDDSTVYYKDWYSNKFRSNVMDTELIGQHPIYASIFLSLAIIFYIELIKNKTKTTLTESWAYTSLTIVNLALSIMLLSKGVLVALAATILFSFTMDKKLRRYKRFVFLIIIAGFIALFTFNRRMSELLRLETYEEVNPNFSTSIRIGVYQCSLEIIKENWIFGYGLGDSQDTLNTCYAEKNDLLLKEQLNTHSQYLDIILKIGVFGLLLFFFFLVNNLIKAKKNGNHTAMLIILFYSIVFLTENILARQSGVILFYFLLLFLNTKKMGNDNGSRTPLQI